MSADDAAQPDAGVVWRFPGGFTVPNETMRPTDFPPPGTYDLRVESVGAAVILTPTDRSAAQPTPADGGRPYRSPVCADGGICYGCKDCQRPDTDAAQPTWDDPRPVHASTFAPGPHVSCDDVRAGDRCTTSWEGVTCSGCLAARARDDAAQPTREPAPELIAQQSPPEHVAKSRVVFAWDCPRCAYANTGPRLDPVETCGACAWEVVIT